MRTDDNHNPTAFTTDLAEEARLVEGVDYIIGTPFPPPSTLDTAHLLGDPIQTTIRVVDSVGFYTEEGGQRWVYIGIPKFIWDSLTPPQKRDIIGFMYQHEGGTAMRPLFPNYGRR